MVRLVCMTNVLTVHIWIFFYTQQFAFYNFRTALEWTYLPPRKERKLLAALSVAPYIMLPSMYADCWLNCSRGPTLQFRRGELADRTNDMHV